MSIFLY